MLSPSSESLGQISAFVNLGFLEAVIQTVSHVAAVRGLHVGLI